MEIYNTFGTQIELLPRITIIYGKEQANEIVHNGIAFEWLWFGIYFKCAI